MYSIVRVSSSIDRASPKAGILRSNARTGPPWCATASQSRSASGVAKLHSVKSGIGVSKPITARGVPLPSDAWQAAHAVS
jgi:hypothetical protein